MTGELTAAVLENGKNIGDTEADEDAKQDVEKGLSCRNALCI